ncbi:hypothetical protein I3760_09G180800 [Carya illinoinensis]|nr:hypothetical protein I3760_09G180800 [Carya illinoinensis]
MYATEYITKPSLGVKPMRKLHCQRQQNIGTLLEFLNLEQQKLYFPTKIIYHNLEKQHLPSTISFYVISSEFVKNVFHQGGIISTTFSHVQKDRQKENLKLVVVHIYNTSLDILAKES